MEGIMCMWFENCGTAGTVHTGSTNCFTSDLTIDSIYNAHWLYVGINDRKSQLHERTRNIKGGMLVCLQINLSLDGHLTYQHCNPQAVSVVP